MHEDSSALSVKLIGSVPTDWQNYNLRDKIKCVNIINKTNKILANKYENGFSAVDIDDTVRPSE